MPPEHEARSRALYDHEQDEPRGRRRRAVADWGVSEDVFDRMPGPRFSRRGEEPRRRATGERDDAPRARFVREDGESAPLDIGGDRPPDEAPRADTRPRRQDEAPDEAPRADTTARWHDDVPRADARQISRTIVIEREPELDAEVFEEEPRAGEPSPREHIAPNGRRTIVIGGRSDRLPVARSRPPRTAVERIGPRPDRIVGYAVALGVLLILIAILTSH